MLLTAFALVAAAMPQDFCYELNLYAATETSMLLSEPLRY